MAKPLDNEAVIISLLRTGDQLIKARRMLEKASLSKLTHPLMPNTRENMSELGTTVDACLDKMKAEAQPYVAAWLRKTFELSIPSPVKLEMLEREDTYSVQGELVFAELLVRRYENPQVMLSIAHPRYFANGVEQYGDDGWYKTPSMSNCGPFMRPHPQTQEPMLIAHVPLFIREHARRTSYYASPFNIVF